MSDSLNTNSAKERLIVALDVPNFKSAVSHIERLKNVVKWFKVGNELFTSAGPEIINYLHGEGRKVFLDLKYHDIPNTVVSAAKSAVDLSVGLFNVHTLGGGKMMTHVMDTVSAYCEQSGVKRPKIIGVTVLTSMGKEDLAEIGIEKEPVDAVLNLASLAKSSGLDGVVASPMEVCDIKAKIGSDFMVVTPGVRPSWAQMDDQKRVMSPKEAIEAGSDMLVVGRPITRADDPAVAAIKTLEEIESAL